MDKTDTRILRTLMVDGRLSARQLAHRLGISTVTALTRIRRMEKEGIIGGYSATIDHEKLGYGLTAVIEVAAADGRAPKVEERVARFENVCCVYDVTGASDTLIVAKFRERGDLSRFVKSLAAIPGVRGTVTHLVLDTVKEDFRMT